jgi:hypothetical protein
MVFEYPGVRNRSYISVSNISSSRVLPVKELLVSNSRPYKFYQVVEHKADGSVACIDQDCNPVSVSINDVAIVNWYE